MPVLQSFARTTSIPHWQNEYRPVPTRVQEKFRVSDSGLLMALILMFDIGFRLTCGAGIARLSRIVARSIPLVAVASQIAFVPQKLAVLFRLARIPLI